MHLDDLDWDILDILQLEGRIGYRELGRRVGLSAPAVAARLRKLEAAGVISGYKAVISPEHVGLRVEAFVQMAVSGSPDADERVIKAAVGIPEIIDVWRVTGRETYLLRVVVPVVHDPRCGTTGRPSPGRCCRPHWWAGPSPGRWLRPPSASLSRPADRRRAG